MYFYSFQIALALTQAFIDIFLKLRALTQITTEFTSDRTVTGVHVSHVGFSGYGPQAVSKLVGK